jgi:hypothetical protein
LHTVSYARTAGSCSCLLDLLARSLIN